MTYHLTCLTPIKGEDRTVTDHWKHLEAEGWVKIRYVEFHFPKQAYWILKGYERSPISRVFRNIVAIARLLMFSGVPVIVGVEPFSLGTLMLKPLRKKHRCIYWTTWSWADERFSGGLAARVYRKIWQDFLKGTVCVASTPEAWKALLAYGATSYYIPHPVDAVRFHPAGAPRPPSGPQRVLFIGELARWKGVPIIIEMIRRKDWTGTEFWFAGRGDFQAEVQQLVADGFPVKYLGRIGGPRVVETLQQADMLILPSVKQGRNEEKFGMVLTEAMACGIPVIASDCVGPRQVVDHGVNGFIIPQNDGEALANAIRKLAGDPRLRAEMGRNGRKKALEVYDVRVVARQWMNVIQEAVG